MRRALCRGLGVLVYLSVEHLGCQPACELHLRTLLSVGRGTHSPADGPFLILYELGGGLFDLLAGGWPGEARVFLPVAAEDLDCAPVDRLLPPGWQAQGRMGPGRCLAGSGRL